MPSFICLYNSLVLLFSKGNYPEIITNNTTPIDHMSTDVLYLVFDNISGAA